MASGGEAGLFTALPEQAAPERVGCGLPRLRCAERDQLEWRPVSLDGLLAEDHRVRLVWGFVEGLDLTPLLAPIKYWHLSSTGTYQGGGRSTGSPVSGPAPSAGSLAVCHGGGDRQRPRSCPLL
jgi:hypothetical protein